MSPSLIEKLTPEHQQQVIPKRVKPFWTTLSSSFGKVSIPRMLALLWSGFHSSAGFLLHVISFSLYPISCYFLAVCLSNKKKHTDNTLKNKQTFGGGVFIIKCD